MLRDRNPNARRVVHRALRRISGECYDNVEGLCRNAITDLSFIVGPLREVFADYQGDQRSRDLYQRMLEIRFHRWLQYSASVDWKAGFQTKRPVFDLITRNNTWTVAYTLTSDDLQAFKKSGISNFIKNDTHTDELNKRWNTLYGAFHECALPEAGLFNVLCKVAQVSCVSTSRPRLTQPSASVPTPQLFLLHCSYPGYGRSWFERSPFARPTCPEIGLRVPDPVHQESGAAVPAHIYHAVRSRTKARASLASC